MQVDDFELLYPQGLLCNIDNVPEGLGSVYLITKERRKAPAFRHGEYQTDQMAKRAATKLRKEQEKVSGQGQNCDILYSEPR